MCRIGFSSKRNLYRFAELYLFAFTIGPVNKLTAAGRTSCRNRNFGTNRSCFNYWRLCIRQIIQEAISCALEGDRLFLCDFHAELIQRRGCSPQTCDTICTHDHSIAHRAFRYTVFNGIALIHCDVNVGLRELAHLETVALGVMIHLKGERTDLLVIPVTCYDRNGDYILGKVAQRHDDILRFPNHVLCRNERRRILWRQLRSDTTDIGAYLDGFSIIFKIEFSVVFVRRHLLTIDRKPITKVVSGICRYRIFIAKLKCVAYFDIDFKIGL